MKVMRHNIEHKIRELMVQFNIQWAPKTTLNDNLYWGYPLTPQFPPAST
jgi:hypothetical protein